MGDRCETSLQTVARAGIFTVRKVCFSCWLAEINVFHWFKQVETEYI